ncbi:MAG: L-threonylcarbamoyladenylate synthase [bacterium]|nr:L-threonylcarbamoyladenylate synthase [bacterium]
METVTVKIRQDADAFSSEEDAALRRAGSIIREGGLVAFPTETVYGLGGDALNPDSSRKIYAAKGRPQDNPLIVHICRFEDMRRIAARIPEEAAKLAEAFWPGPLTMILNKSDCVPAETTGGLDTVAVRFPANKTAQKLIEYGGGYVAAPSANRSGRPSPTLAKYVCEDMDGRIDMIVDGGGVEIGLESTIVDLTVSPPQILRPGYVTKEMLEAVLGEVAVDAAVLNADSGQVPRAPGMKYRHYAPRGELVIVEGSPADVAAYINRAAGEDSVRGEKTGVIGTSEFLREYRTDVVKCVGSRKEEESIARRLFTVLREFDEEGVTRIYSESFEASGLGQAIMNRLLRAAGHRVIQV